ncbi:hypothetical protein B5X24_HaOG204328 [Helicoverpa armigera]|uniref:Uncharacterized protein n=1 Tax=Helicoverpa armigera TaxID=29058 RepID=A0A2W1BU22_HELAM|nr:hypothetical protein B5X24_HaOG204328 [Helicoverpa armigera]
MSCDAILSWNLLLLRRASDSFSKIIHYSVCSQQVSSKKYFCSNCYSNLPVKSVETEKSCKPACLGPRHICVTCDIPKALVLVDTSRKDPFDINLQRSLLYKIVNMKKMFSLYWSAAIRKVTMCTKVPPEHTQIGVNKFDGIDMTPVRPKRKENPSPLEIPEPSVPGENLPGFPIPGIPDVAIPIVPELPVPDMPEIPAPTPQVPGKPKPKLKPLPGHPVPTLQDTLRERWPLPFIRDLIRQRFPIPAFQDSPVTLISPFIQSPLERNKIVQNIMRSNIRYLSTPNQNSNGKLEISKGLIIPPMVQDLLKRDKIYVPKDEIICTLSKLSPAEIQATYDLIKRHKQKVKDTQEIPNDFIFGMTYEQFQQLLTFVAISKKQENPSQLLGNKLYIPSQLFINNAKFLVPVKKQEYFKGIFTGQIQVKDRKYFKRF